MSTTTSSTPTSSNLRKRLFPLNSRSRTDNSHATSSNPSLISPLSEQSLFSMSPQSPPGEISESTDNEDFEDRPSTSATSTPRRPSPHMRATRKMKEWYEFDKTVLLVLVAPVGSWITGNGEWIRDLLLLVLGVYYLHQIIEVPWNLYMASLPPSVSLSENTPKTLAACQELRRIELFLLTLTVLSPFIGTLFLKYVLYLVTGSADPLSWFSTSLFVFTCGIRPWKHLIDRIDGRVDHLQSTFQPHPIADSSQEMQDLRNRLEQLENLLRKDTEDIYQYVDEAVDSLEANVRRQERKWEKQQNRLTRAETSIANVAKETKPSSNSALDLVSRLSVVSAFIPAQKPIASPPVRPRPRVSNGTTKRRLETIPEETKVSQPVVRSLVAVVLEAIFQFMTLPFWPAMWILNVVLGHR